MIDFMKAAPKILSTDRHAGNKLKSCGRDVKIYDSSKLINPENISLGNSVKIDDFVFLASGPETTIGDFVHISPHCMIAGGGTLVMEDFSGLSAGVRVHTGTDDFAGDCLVNPAVPARYRKVIRSSVRIGRHATVCSGSTVLPGVVIGEGCVIGANSLVSADCEPWHYYVGSPARKLKARPRDGVLAMEGQLRSELFSPDGRYIPANERTE